MQGKITLITPPDLYENENISILFVHLSDKDQETVTSWLSKQTYEKHINIYFYNNEAEAPWLLHAMSRCEYKFIDLSSMNLTTSTLLGYMLGKTNTYYKTDNIILAEICQHINQNRIINIENFLERVFNAQVGYKP